VPLRLQTHDDAVDHHLLDQGRLVTQHRLHLLRGHGGRSFAQGAAAESDDLGALALVVPQKLQLWEPKHFGDLGGHRRSSFLLCLLRFSRRESHFVGYKRRMTTAFHFFFP
jgi:hypothetical protein